MRRLFLALPFALLACPVPPRVHPRAAEEVSRGYRYLTGGDAERAEVAFRHALAFDPDFPEGENGLGLVARTREEFGAARRAFERAISLRPDFAEAHANLGELLLAEGHGDEAERCLRAALAIDPDLSDARQNLARALIWRGLEPGADRRARFAEARRELLHLLESAPDRAAAHHDLGFLAYLADDWPAAEAAYRRAAELAPRLAEAQHGLCIARVRMGRCAEGAAACQACLDVRPGEARCQRSLEAARACAELAPGDGPGPGSGAGAGTTTSRSRSRPATGTR
jgi:Tfp pilus assembly protein PilF